MPQTSTALNTVDAVIEISTTGAAASWTNISGSTNKVEPPEQSADIGSVATLEGQYKIVRAGKLNPAEVKFTILYTEATTEAFAVLFAQANLPARRIYVRWAPGGSNGDYRFYSADANDTVSPGYISAIQLPGADAEESAPTLLSFTVVCTKIARTANQPSPSASLSPSASTSI